MNKKFRCCYNCIHFAVSEKKSEIKTWCRETNFPVGDHICTKYEPVKPKEQ